MQQNTVILEYTLKYHKDFQIIHSDYPLIKCRKPDLKQIVDYNQSGRIHFISTEENNNRKMKYFQRVFSISIAFSSFFGKNKEML